MNNPRPWQKKEIRRTIQKRQKSFCIFTEGETEKIYFNDFDLQLLKCARLEVAVFFILCQRLCLI